MACRPKIDHLDAVRETRRVDEHDVLRLEVGVDEAKLSQLVQRRQDLLRDRADVLKWQWLKLVVLEEVIEVLLEHFEDETCVVLVLEELMCADKVVLVRILMPEASEDVHFYLALSGIRRVVLEDLYRDDFIRATFPALDDLAEGATTKKLKDLIGRR